MRALVRVEWISKTLGMLSWETHEELQVEERPLLVLELLLQALRGSQRPERSRKRGGARGPVAQSCGGEPTAEYELYRSRHR